MTRFDTPPIHPPQNNPSSRPSTWVKTQLEGAGTYTLVVVSKSRQAKPQEHKGCAYAKLSMMESGAIMASFPIMGMVSGTIRSMLGATSFDLATPLTLPAFVFGHDIEIPAGKHPLVFVLESWVVLFRPQNTLQL